MEWSFELLTFNDASVNILDEAFGDGGLLDPFMIDNRTIIIPLDNAAILLNGHTKRSYSAWTRSILHTFDYAGERLNRSVGHGY